MPVTLRAHAVVHGEGTKQSAIFIPLPADAVQPTVSITQFLGQLAVEVPCAVKTVELPPHLPDLRVDTVVTVKKLFYTKFRHGCKFAFISAVCRFAQAQVAHSSCAPQTSRIFKNCAALYG